MKFYVAQHVVSYNYQAYRMWPLNVGRHVYVYFSTSFLLYILDMSIIVTFNWCTYLFSYMLFAYNASFGHTIGGTQSLKVAKKGHWISPCNIASQIYFLTKAKNVFLSALCSSHKKWRIWSCIAMMIFRINTKVKDISINSVESVENNEKNENSQVLKDQLEQFTKVVVLDDTDNCNAS